MTKYDKLEAEYNALETPEQQWAWVLAHKDEVIVQIGSIGAYFVMKKHRSIVLFWAVDDTKCSEWVKSLLSVLGIEAEGV